MKTQRGERKKRPGGVGLWRLLTCFDAFGAQTELLLAGFLGD